MPLINNMRLLVTYPKWVFQPIKDVVNVLGNSFLDCDIEVNVRGADTVAELDSFVKSGDYTHILCVNTHDFVEREKKFAICHRKDVVLMAYNLEQSPIEGQNYPWASMRLGEIGLYGPYFDYIVHESESKRADIQRMGFRTLSLPLPYHPCIDPEVPTPTVEEKEYDIFFTGAGNERRQSLVNALLKEGLTFAPAPLPQALSNTYKSEMIRKSRLCLNLHFSDMEYFEKPRIMYDILCNKGVCVSEKIAHPEEFKNTRDLFMCSYSNMVPTILMLAKKFDNKILQVGLNGYETFIRNYAYDKIIPEFIHQLAAGDLYRVK